MNPSGLKAIVVIVAMLGLSNIPQASAQTGGFLERLEQRVLGGLRVPGEGGPEADVSTTAAAAATPAAGSQAKQVAQSNPTPPNLALPSDPTNLPAIRPSVASSSEPVVLGLELEEIYVPGGGLLVARVAAESPAAASGVQARDILQMIDGRLVLKLADVVDALAARRPGDRIVLRLSRNGMVLETAALLAGLPGKEPSAALPPPSVASTNPPANPALIPAGRLGMDVDDLTSAQQDTAVQRGAVVVAVKPNSPADALGIQIGDIIVAVDGRVVTGARSMVTATQSLRSGQISEITYFRGKEMHRQSVPVAGADGLLAADVLASIRAKNEALAKNGADASSGITGWIGGLGKMFSGKPTTTADATAPSPSTSPPQVAPTSAAVTPDIVSPTAREKVLLEQVQKLEQRIAELEKRLEPKSQP